MKKNIAAFLLFFVSMILTAAFTPWWGTPIVIAVSFVIFRLPVKVLALVSFAAWALAAAWRDGLADHGPTRVIAKLMSLESVGFPPGSRASELSVLAMAGMIGLLFALFVGGLLRSIYSSQTMISTTKKSLR